MYAINNEGEGGYLSSLNLWVMQLQNGENIIMSCLDKISYTQNGERYML